MGITVHHAAVFDLHLSHSPRCMLSVVQALLALALKFLLRHLYIPPQAPSLPKSKGIKTE
jgi:hypothetical protein